MRSLLGFLVQRLLGLAAVLVGVAALTHAILRFLRPDVFDDGRSLPAGVLHHVERVFLHADLGRGGLQGRPVLDLMLEGLPADASLAAGGLLLGLLLGLAGGALADRYDGSVASRALQVLAVLALCAPVYWMALVCVRSFTPEIGWLGIGAFFGESAGYAPLTEDPVSWLRGLFVPWLVLALPLAGAALRLARSGLQEVRDADFLRTARAKGLSERLVRRRHALPAAAAPVLALAGANMALLITNVVLVEQVFNVPGVFRETLRAVRVGDFQVLQGLVLVGALLVVVANAAVDLALRTLDPRVRS